MLVVPVAIKRGRVREPSALTVTMFWSARSGPPIRMPSELLSPR